MKRSLTARFKVFTAAEGYSLLHSWCVPCKISIKKKDGETYFYWPLLRSTLHFPRSQAQLLSLYGGPGLVRHMTLNSGKLGKGSTNHFEPPMDQAEGGTKTAWLGWRLGFCISWKIPWWSTRDQATLALLLSFQFILAWVRKKLEAVDTIALEEALWRRHCWEQLLLSPEPRLWQVHTWHWDPGAQVSGALSPPLRPGNAA